jgi:hypothetical protein
MATLAVRGSGHFFSEALPVWIGYASRYSTCTYVPRRVLYARYHPG